MFVLGIDPGLSRCGYGAVRRADNGRGVEAVAHGVITTPPDDALPQRLVAVQRALRALIAEHRPDVVVVERVFFQTNVRTAMSVGQASGLALAEAAAAGCEVVQYTSNEVKQAIAGFGAAPKDQIQRMVRTLLALAEVPKPADAADALALALCHLARARWSASTSASAGLSETRDANKQNKTNNKANTAGPLGKPLRIATHAGGVPLR